MTELRINTQIPNTMAMEGLEFLARLVQRLPESPILVEAGALYGSTAWTFAHNAPENAQIYSIDPWIHEPWMDALAKKYKDCPPLSVDAFRHFTRDCPGVKTVVGFAPDAYIRNEKIDFFFEDATHTNPVFKNNLNFFSIMLKPGGILCGDDFGPAWPDIVRGVVQQSRRWRTPFVVRGRVWAMVKPQAADGERSGDIIDLLSDDNHGRWGVSIVTHDKHRFTASQDAFSGAFGLGASIKELTFWSKNSPLHWKITAYDSNGGRTTFGKGEKFDAGDAVLTGLKVECFVKKTPVNGQFQCVFKKRDDNGRVYRRPRAFGEAMKTKPEEGLELCDLRVRIDS